MPLSRNCYEESKLKMEFRRSTQICYGVSTRCRIEKKEENREGTQTRKHPNGYPQLEVFEKAATKKDDHNHPNPLQRVNYRKENVNISGNDSCAQKKHFCNTCTLMILELKQKTLAFPQLRASRPLCSRNTCTEIAGIS